MARGLDQEQAKRASSRNIGALRTLLPFVLAYKGRLVAVLFMLTIAAAATLVIPIGVRMMIDYGFSGEDVGEIDRYFGAMLLVALILAVSSAGRFYFVMHLGERVVADIRSHVYAHLLTLSPYFYERTRTGEILSRLTTDTTLIQSIVGASASIALRNIFMFIGASIMLTVTSPRLAAYFLLLAPAVILPLVIFGRSVRRQSNTAQDKMADTSALAGESFNAVQTVQAFTQEPREGRRFHEAVELAFKAAKRRIGLQAILTAIIILLVFSSIVGILWTGARFVGAGEMTSGQLMQFVLFAVLAASSVGALSEVWGEVQRAAGASERLAELTKTQSDISESETLERLPESRARSIAMDNIVFRYPSRDKVAVLEDFTLHLQPGEKVALVGPSGAGKSTVFQLLMRFYDPQGGGVSIDGVDIRKLALKDLRSQFSLVPQEAAIFGASAGENIRYGRPEATPEETLRAAEVATADRFIEELPEGFDTDLGQKGVTLSGGQRQRIAIARAVLRDAPILLLDEATSALDSENEQLVQTALDKLMQNHTTLIIAHRLSTILKADRIIVMDKGNIVETGRHEDLVRKDGLYARLAELQFGVNAGSMEGAES